MQQLLRGAEIARLDALGKPSGRVSKQATGIPGAATVLPETGEARRGPQLERLRSLLAGDVECAQETRLRFRHVGLAAYEDDLTPLTVQLGLVEPLAVKGDPVECVRLVNWRLSRDWLRGPLALVGSNFLGKAWVQSGCSPGPAASVRTSASWPCAVSRSALEKPRNTRPEKHLPKFSDLRRRIIARLVFLHPVGVEDAAAAE